MSLLINPSRSRAFVICGVFLLAAGCAGTKRHLANSDKSETNPTFSLASSKSSKAPFATKPNQHADTLKLVQSLDAQAPNQAELTAPQAISSSESSASAVPRDATAAPDNFRELTEQQMLNLAFANSPVLRQFGLRILESPSTATTIYDSAISATDPFFGPQAALAEFDSSLTASVNAQNNDRVFNNVIVGGAVQELVQDLVTFDTGWQRRTRSGAVLELNGLTGYDNNNRAGNSFPNYWETQLEAGIRQPLMQGAGRTFNEIAGPNARPGFNFSNGIIIARLDNKISDADFKIQVREFTRELYAAYWDLDRHYRNYESVKRAEQLAYRTWQTVLAKSKANLSGGEANKEAQSRAKYYSYKHEVQVALGGQGDRSGLYVAERRLRDMIGIPIVDGELLRPADDPVSVKFVFDYDLLISRAMSARTELRRQSLVVQQQQLRLVAAKNFLLPQMDLIGKYRLRGFGDDLYGSGPRFSSAYQDFYSFDHQEWEFGLEMGVVAGRRQAHAAVRNAALKASRERSILAQQKQSIQLQISDAYAETASSYAAMQTSQAQVDAATERLKSSEILFASDKILIEFLLDAQEDVLKAELQLSRDQTRYTDSLVAINAATGSLLDDIGIFIQQTGCQSNVLYLSDASVPSVAEKKVSSTTAPLH